MFHPFPYQSECLVEVEGSRNEGAKTALVVMASGLGKTVTAAFDAKRWFENHRGRLMYLCHQNDILYQAKTTFEAVLGDQYTYGYFHGQEKNLHDVDCLFASLQTMEKYLEFFDPKEFGYIVVDESHHSQAQTFKRVIEHFEPQFLLGVTATPDRLDQRNIREIYGPEVYFLPLEEALARRLVTPVDYRMLSDEIVISGIVDTPQGKLNIGYLNRKIFVPKRDEEIAKIIAKHAAEFEDPRIIIFCSTVQHCDHFCAQVPGSLAIHSKIPIKERALRIELFRQGLITTVVTVDCFNEGIDIPQANVVVFLRSTASPTIFLQQLGRGLRLSDGKDKVIALDFIGNCERINLVYDLWKAVDHERKALAGQGESNRKEVEPMTLNIIQPNFSERIVMVIELLERLKPKMIIDYPDLLKEYSSKNALPPHLVVAGTNKRIWWVCSKCSHEWQAKGGARVIGNGCPGCAGQVATSANNLATNCPELAKEYMPPPKNKLAATELTPGSGKRVWWKCPTCSHEWLASVNNRAGHKRGCPACYGRVATPNNNLATKYPELAKEYMAPPKNELPADQVHNGSHVKFWWKCSKCGHEWQSRSADRVKKSSSTGCPACAGKSGKATPFNSLAVKFPELAKEYMPPPKNELPADQVTTGKLTKFWWKCSTCGHEWKTKCSHRTAGKGCPVCAKKRMGPPRKASNS